MIVIVDIFLVYVFSTARYEFTEDILETNRAIHGPFQKSS